MCDLQPVSTACFYFSVMRKSDGFLGGLLPQSVRENGEGAENTLRCPCAPWKWSLGRDCCRLPTPSVCGGPAGRISQTFKRPLCLGSGGRREAPDRLGRQGEKEGQKSRCLWAAFCTMLTASVLPFSLLVSAPSQRGPRSEGL